MNISVYKHLYLYFQNYLQFSSVHLLSHVQLFSPTQALQASLSITNLQNLQKVKTIVSVMPSNNISFGRPLLLTPLTFPSIRVFYNKSVLCIRWQNYWSFSFSPSNGHPRLITLRMDWLDLLAVQVTRNSLLQHHSSKASILQRSSCFILQLSHPLYDYWKNHTIELVDLCWQSNVSAF